MGYSLWLARLKYSYSVLEVSPVHHAAGRALYYIMKLHQIHVRYSSICVAVHIWGFCETHQTPTNPNRFIIFVVVAVTFYENHTIAEQLCFWIFVFIRFVNFCCMLPQHVDYIISMTSPCPLTTFVNSNAYK